MVGVLTALARCSHARSTFAVPAHHVQLVDQEKINPAFLGNETYMCCFSKNDMKSTNTRRQKGHGEAWLLPPELTAHWAILRTLGAERSGRFDSRERTFRGIPRLFP